MTTISQTWGYTCHICDKVSSTILNFLKNVTRSIQLSRQLEANEFIAKAILHEYPEHTIHSLTAELNAKTLREYYRDC